MVLAELFNDLKIGSTEYYIQNPPTVIADEFDEIMWSHAAL